MLEQTEVVRHTRAEVEMCTKIRCISNNLLSLLFRTNIVLLQITKLIPTHC